MKSIHDHEMVFVRHACLLNVTLDIRYLVNSFLAWMADTFMQYMAPKYTICIKYILLICVYKSMKTKIFPDNKQYRFKAETKIHI